MVFHYTWNSQSRATSMRKGHLTCVGALRGLLDEDPQEKPLKTMNNWIVKNHTPQGWPTDTYYLYYDTFALFTTQHEAGRTEATRSCPC